MLSLSFPFSGLILQASLTLILAFLKIHIRVLQGLFTYIHPDTLGHNNASSSGGGRLRAAIRRPDSSDSGYDIKPRSKSKQQKPEFDENNAQIFRLLLDEAHLQSRVYFSDYQYAFTYTFLAISCLLLHRFLNGSEDHSGFWVSGAVVPILFWCLALLKVFVSLTNVSLERSASKRSEKQLSVVFGVFGFFLGGFILLGIGDWVFDFQLKSIDGVGRFIVATVMGYIPWLLYVPASKCARAFWIGTDQLDWNLSIISCTWTGRLILYASYLSTLFASLLWVAPLTEVLVNKRLHDGNGKQLSSRVDTLAGNVGLSRSEFAMFRRWCLFVSGFLQALAIRPNLQMYLNEAVLSWYQRLHASKIPDLDYSRAKVFLHNHYLCLSVLQFFAPAALLLLFLGLSQIEAGNMVGSLDSFTGSALINEVALLLAWWVAFIWAVFTSISLLLYRHGIWYVS